MKVRERGVMFMGISVPVGSNFTVIEEFEKFLEIDGGFDYARPPGCDIKFKYLLR